MRTLKLLLLLITLGPLVLSAQVSAEEDSTKLKITIGKSTDNELTKSKPAEIVGTFPAADSVDNSWMVNGFVEWGVTTAKTRVSIALSAEMHRNTLIAKKQDVRQAGFTAGKVFGFKDKKPGNILDWPMTLMFRNSQDKVKDTEEMQIIWGNSFQLFRGVQILKTNSLFPAPSTTVANYAMFEHDHNIGLIALPGEEVLLSNIDFQFNVYLLPKLSEKVIKKYELLKFSYSIKARSELDGNLDRDLQPLVNYQLGFNVPFGEGNNSSIGIAYDWIKGADPLKGLDNQEYQTISFKAKLVL